MANTALTRSFGTATNTQKFTISVWVKRNSLATSGYQHIWHTTDGSYDGYFRFRNSENQLQLNMGIASPSTPINYRTNRVFRDVNAWYHIVASVDTTLSTSSDRVKFYVNGTRETSFQSSDAPTQNNSYDYLSSSGLGYIGRDATSAQHYFDGSMSHFHFIDGTAYDASAFGSTDATTGEWKINTSPSVTYGNNGFFILKDGNSVTDQSTNTNNFTVASGTLTNTEDCPSNVFCTWNPLNSYYGGGTFSWGNNKIVLPNKNGAWNTGTLGMTKGKYYWEIKVGGDANGGEVQVGIADKSPNGNSSGSTAGTSFGYNSNGEYGIYAWNGAFIGNAVPNSYTAYGATSCEDGYIMIAVDLDNNKFYGGLNGTWFASGNPSTGTNGKTIQAVEDTVDKCYYPAVSTYQGYSGTVETNFGNGYFADNAVSSAGTNASGNGIFKYDVPTGYTALSTKGLNL